MRKLRSGVRWRRRSLSRTVVEFEASNLGGINNLTYDSAVGWFVDHDAIERARRDLLATLCQEGRVIECR